MHALEKLWKPLMSSMPRAAWRPNSWSLDRMLRILLGDVGQVVEGIRQSITKRGLSGAGGNAAGVADHLDRNRTRMHYHEHPAELAC